MQLQCTDGPSVLWLDQAIMENESDSPSRTIRLMIQEARESTKGLDPNNNIFTHAGVKMPHPESYSGEADLERFEGLHRSTAAMVIAEPATRFRPCEYPDTSQVLGQLPER